MKKSTNIIIVTSVICLIVSVFVTVISCGATAPDVTVEAHGTVEADFVPSEEHTTFARPLSQVTEEGLQPYRTHSG